jgi:hypothetical protein
VRSQKAPFDHPELFVPDGQHGDTTSVATDAAGTAVDDFLRLPAVGASGGAPLAPFLSPTPASPGPPTDLEPVATPVPDSVDLGAVAVGRKADAQVVVNSVGAAPLTIGAISVAGPNAADFSVAGSTCGGASLRKDGSCTITVRFKPSAPGARAARLVVADNAADSPLTIDLAGTGS